MCVWCVHALCKRDVLCVCYAVVCCADECVYVSQTAMHAAGISMCAHGFVWVCVSVSPCMHMCVPVCICVHVPVCACVHVCTSVCTFTSLHACLCMHACVCAHALDRGARVHVYHMGGRESVRVYICMYMRVHMCTGIPGCMFGHTHQSVPVCLHACRVRVKVSVCLHACRVRGKVSVFACLPGVCENVSVFACLQGARENVSMFACLQGACESVSVCMPAWSVCDSASVCLHVSMECV